MARLISRAELSRCAGVSDAAISKACKAQFPGACDGRRVDVDHPEVVAYLKGKGKKPPAVRRAAVVKPPEAPAPSPRFAPQLTVERQSGTDEDLDELADLLEPLMRRFGTAQAFRDWLVALKTIQEVRSKRLDNEETEGRLIERELVSTHIFSALENFHKRLLTDVVTTISQRLYGAAKGGVPLEEAKRIVRGIISEQLKPVKITAARVLRNA